MCTRWKTSAVLDTEDTNAPVILGEDVTYKDDAGETVTVTDETTLVLSIEAKPVTETEAASTKTAVTEDVKANVTESVKKSLELDSGDALTSEQEATVNKAMEEAVKDIEVKAVDVELTLVTETTDETGETTVDETPVHPVGTTTVKLSAAQLGMAGEDLNLYHFVASHTNANGTSQTVTGEVDEKGENVTFVTNGLSTIWIGNVPPRTVEFDTGSGGTAVPSQKVKFGNRVDTRELPKKIERAGYLFCGWNYDLTVTPVIYNMTVTAVWVQGVKVPASRITVTPAEMAGITLTKEDGSVTAAAAKDVELAAGLKVNLTVANLSGAVKYAVRQDAQAAAAIEAKDMTEVSGGSVTLDPVTVTNGSGEAVAGKTSYYIKWVDGEGEVTLEEVVVVVDNGQGAADSMTVTRSVNRGLGRFEPYLTSSKKTDAPKWVGYINGNLQKNFENGVPKDYWLYLNVGFEEWHFEGTWNIETQKMDYEYSAKDYDILTLEFKPFSGESFDNKTITANFGYYTSSGDVQIPCTPVKDGSDLKLILDTKKVNAPATNRYIGLYLHLTVDGEESEIYFNNIINPNYAGVINEEGRNGTFTDMATLKAAMNTANADKESDWYLNYNGAETEFTISESIYIPVNCHLSFYGSQKKPVSVTVANGVTVTMRSEENNSSYISCGDGAFIVARGGKVTAIATGTDEYGSLLFSGIHSKNITVESGGAIEVKDNAPFMLEGQSNSSAVCTLEPGSTVTVGSRTLHIQNFNTAKLGATTTVSSTGYLYMHNDNNEISGTVSVNSSNWRGAEFYGTTTVTESGKVNAAGTSRGYAVEFNGPLNNKGAITVASDVAVLVSNVGFASQNSGTIELNGTLDLSGTKLANTGSITGSGTVVGALGDDTTSYDELNGLEYVDVGLDDSKQTPDNYSRYKFTADPADTVQVTLYKASLVNEQGGTTAGSIRVDTVDFPAE